MKALGLAAAVLLFSASVWAATTAKQEITVIFDKVLKRKASAEEVAYWESTSARGNSLLNKIMLSAQGKDAEAVRNFLNEQEALGTIKNPSAELAAVIAETRAPQSKKASGQKKTSLGSAAKSAR